MSKSARSLAGEAIVAACLVIAVVATLTSPVASDEKDQVPNAIKKLRQERADTLKEVLDLAIAAQRTGLYEIKNVYDARNAYLRARLDVCETKAERLETLSELVAVADSWHKHLADSFSIGRTTGKDDVLRGKADFLEARIALEQAKLAK